MMVAAPPGTMWLTVDHDADAGPVGSACTGVLAGWTFDAIERLSTLAADADGSYPLTLQTRTPDHSVALLWGHMDAGEALTFTLPTATAEHPVHLLLQAEQFGHPVDLSLTVDPLTTPQTVSDNPVSDSPDPEIWNWHPADTASPPRFVLTATAGAGDFFLQVHTTGEALP